MNLGPETRNGYYISAEMKKVWAVQMELLKKLLEVCQKYNLKIWADSGTLLGAIREHGYIPWDDDIDMTMFREDFDKLQTIAKKEFKSPYFWQSGYTDLFPNGMGKLRMDNTAAIERASIYRKQHQGIFIDIFPLDVMPDDQDELNMFVEEVLKSKEEMTLICEHHYSLTNWKYNYQVFKKVKKAKKKGFQKSFKDFDNLVKRYKDKDYKNVSLIAWYYHERNLKKREWFDKTIYVPFEDILIPVPKNYHAILTKSYGENYMTPIQAPSMHDGLICVSTDHSYKDFLPSLRRKLIKEACNAMINRLLSLFKKL